jgi:hypothetical protein
VFIFGSSRFKLFSPLPNNHPLLSKLQSSQLQTALPINTDTLSHHTTYATPQSLTPNRENDSVLHLGLPAPRSRDGALHAAHRPSSIHPPEEDVHVRSQTTSTSLSTNPLLIAQKCSFISENPVVAKLQYGLKITFIFILILFIDSVNRVYRVQVELAAATDSQGQGGYVSTTIIPTPHACVTSEQES